MPPGGGGLGGPLAYLLAWLLAGAAAAAAVLLLVERGASEPGAKAPRAVHEIVLGDAMRRAQCSLREAPRAERPASARVRPGIYDAPLSPTLSGRAVAVGLIVVEYRRDLRATSLDEQLAGVQRAAPRGTIVAPAPAPTRGSADGPALRALAYGRVLSCRETGAAALDAVQLFAGRFVGLRARAS